MILMISFCRALAPGLPGYFLANRFHAFPPLLSRQRAECSERVAPALSSTDVQVQWRWWSQGP